MIPLLSLWYPKRFFYFNGFIYGQSTEHHGLSVSSDLRYSIIIFFRDCLFETHQKRGKQDEMLRLTHQIWWVQLRISDSLDIVSWLILLIAPLSYLWAVASLTPSCSATFSNVNPKEMRLSHILSLIILTL